MQAASYVVSGIVRLQNVLSDYIYNQITLLLYFLIKKGFIFPDLEYNHFSGNLMF